LVADLIGRPEDRIVKLLPPCGILLHAAPVTFSFPAVDDPRHRTLMTYSNRAAESRASTRLAVLAASPVYYQAPLYRRIAAQPGIRFTAIFASDAGIRPRDVGYGMPIVWDEDALSGYDSVFLRRSRSNPIGGSFLSLADWDVCAYLLRQRFDVLWLHGYNFLTHVLAVATQRALGAGVIFREEQTLIHSRPFVRTLLKEVGLRILFRDGPALYIGSESRQWFEHYGVPPARLVFAPYVVDNEGLRAAHRALADARQDLRRDFGLRPDIPVLLTVSRLVESKQPEVLLDAFRRVRERFECSLLIVGAGRLEKQLRRAIEAQGIPDVCFAGFLNRRDISRAYACADVFALLSRCSETWGLVVNEAMNFGLPVVVTDRVGCARDLVRDGYNGYVVRHDDVEVMANCLLRLLRDRDLRRAFGDESIRIIDKWTYDSTAAGVIEAVDLAMSARHH
jgi:glycosyltransferase involved in cell wall biosynthesis